MTLDQRIAQERRKADRYALELHRGRRANRNKHRLAKANAMLAVLEQVKRLPVL